MNFLISGNTKESKHLVKKVLKKMGLKTTPFSNVQLTGNKANQALHFLGKTMEVKKISEIDLSIIIDDKEGKIEAEGNRYTFDSLIFKTMEGYFPSLLDLIREDLFSDTDENMSAEESYRNDNILLAIEEELSLPIEDLNVQISSSEEGKASFKKPWLRKGPSDTPIQTEKNETQEQLVKEKDVEVKTKMSAFEEVVFLDESEDTEKLDEQELIKTEKDTYSEEKVTKMDKNKKSFLPEKSIKKDISINIPTEVIDQLDKYKEEIHQQTKLDKILEIFPPKAEWMIADQQLFLNDQFLEESLPNIYQAFSGGQEEIVFQAEGMLRELADDYNNKDWKALAKQELTQAFINMDKEVKEHLEERTKKQVQELESKKKELNEEEKVKIAEAVQAIKADYENRRNKAYLLSDEMLNAYVKEKEDELKEKKMKQLQKTSVKISSDNYQEVFKKKELVIQSLLEKGTELHQNTTEIITEKYRDIQQRLIPAIEEWELLYKKSEEEKKMIQEKEKKEKEETLRLDIQQKEVDLKEQALQLEKERQENEFNIEQSRIKLQEEQLNQRRKVQDEYLDSLSNQMANPLFNQALMNQTSNNAQSNDREVNYPLQPLEKSQGLSPKIMNKWMVGFFVMAGLLASGGSAVVVHSLSQNKVVEVQKENEKTLSSVVKELKENNDAQIEKIKENYDNKLSDMSNELEKSTSNKTFTELNDAIVDDKSQLALSIYEKLNKEEQKELGAGQKKAIKDFYQEFGQFEKAKEVK